MEQTQYIGYSPGTASPDLNLEPDAPENKAREQKPLTEKETYTVSAEEDFPTRRVLESQNEGEHGAYLTKHGAGSFYTTDPYEIEDGVDRSYGPMDHDA